MFKIKEVLQEMKEAKEIIKEAESTGNIENNIDYTFAKFDLAEYYQCIFANIAKLPEERQCVVEQQILDILDEGEILYSKPKIGNKPAIMIHLDDEMTQDAGYYKDPYIGVYDGPSFSKSKNMARVRVKSATIENHDNTDNKGRLGHLPANSKQLKMLHDLMDQKCNAGQYKGMTIKDAINAHCRKNFESFVTIKDDEFSDFKEYNDTRSKDKLNKQYK